MDRKSWLNNFNIEQEYVLWGCTEFAEALIVTLKDVMNIKYIVDRDCKLEGSKFKEIEVKMPQILKNEKNKKVIITNHFTGTRNVIKKQLEGWGYKENKDYSFYEYFIVVWSWKYKNRIALSYTEINITNFCTLKCEKCASYIPYIKEPMHHSVDNIKRDIKKYFQVIDWCARFRILGGEPLLHPDLIKVLNFIQENYRDRIGELTIVTNGTILPKQNLIVAMKMSNANFSISDYSNCEHVLTKKEQYEKFINLCCENNIEYHFNRTLRWMDLGNPNIRQNLTHEKLKERYMDCKLDRRGLADGMLFSCVNEVSAYRGNIMMFYPEDVLMLDELVKWKRDDIYEKIYHFDAEGVFEKGYLEFCRHCNGEGALNSSFVPVAQQIK